MEQRNFLEELYFLTKKARGGDFNINIKCFLITKIKSIKLTAIEYRVIMFRKLLSGLFKISR